MRCGAVTSTERWVTKSSGFLGLVPGEVEEMYSIVRAMHRSSLVQECVLALAGVAEHR